MDARNQDTLVVLGPTASGKTRLGVALARELGGEILSADSRQVYRTLDIGTGKDLHEYRQGGPEVAVHLIDLVDPAEEFNLFQFQRRFFEAWEAVRSRGALPVVVGGTGLYLDSVLRGYQLVDAPENPALRQELASWPSERIKERLREIKGRLHSVAEVMSHERLVRALEIALFSREHPQVSIPRISPLILGTHWNREVLRQRIRVRLGERLEQGLIEEVDKLHASGISWARLEALGLEYRFVAEFLQHKIQTRDELVKRLGIAIGQFAKRQESWFRRMERMGIEIHWIEQGEPELARKVVREASLVRAGQGGRQAGRAGGP